jgi:hypothetical protein
MYVYIILYFFQKKEIKKPAARRRTFPCSHRRYTPALSPPGWRLTKIKDLQKTNLAKSEPYYFYYIKSLYGILFRNFVCSRRERGRSPWRPDEGKNKNSENVRALLHLLFPAPIQNKSKEPLFPRPTQHKLKKKLFFYNDDKTEYTSILARSGVPYSSIS